MMDIQHQRVLELCNELRLGGLAALYTALAQKAAESHSSFADVKQGYRTRPVWRIAAPGRSIGLILPHKTIAVALALAAKG